jgi:hypothetical protein
VRHLVAREEDRIHLVKVAVDEVAEGMILFVEAEDGRVGRALCM